MEENVNDDMEYAEWVANQRKELEEYADKHGIRNLDPDIVAEIGNVRNPLMVVRGKPLTAEQTKQLITGEVPLFRVENGSGENEGYDPRMHGSVLGDLFRGAPSNPWIYSDGTIGGDFLFVKYPYWDEIFPPYMNLAEKYPFLDIVISFTTVDGCCCYWCVHGCLRNDASRRNKAMEKCGCKDCEPYWDKIMEYYHADYGWKEDGASYFEGCYFSHWDNCHVRSDVGDLVRLAIWIHNGRTDVLFGEEAADKFREYNTLYCAPEYEFMFSTGLYWGEEVRICSRAFVEECFEYIGKPKSLYDECVEKGFLEPFPEGAAIVTKEWVTQQYNAFIKRQAGIETDAGRKIKEG